MGKKQVKERAARAPDCPVLHSIQPGISGFSARFPALSACNGGSAISPANSV
jgi:hypothetical protein